MIKEEYFGIFPNNILKKVNHLHNNLIITIQSLKDDFLIHDMDEITTWGELAADEDLCNWLCENIDKENTAENAASKLLKCFVLRDYKVTISVESIPLITIKLIDP